MKIYYIINIKKLRLLIFLGCNIYANSLMGQVNQTSETLGADSLAKLSLVDLMNIEIVTASKESEKINETPAVVNIITAEEIRSLNFNTLEEVLEYSVGIASVTAEANRFTTTTVRGNTQINYNTNTLLLLDGIPIYNPYHGSFELQTIPFSSIESVEIVKGSNSVLYGTNAINAVINIRTRNTNQENDTTIVTGRIRYGSYWTITGNTGYIRKKK